MVGSSGTTGTGLSGIEVMDFGLGMDGTTVTVPVDMGLGQEWEHNLEMHKFLASLGVAGGEQGPSELDLELGMEWNFAGGEGVAVL